MELIVKIIDVLISRYRGYKIKKLKNQLGYCGSNVDIRFDTVCKPEHIFLDDHTNIYVPFTFISEDGCFYMKKNSGAAQGLTVITDTHNREIKHLLKDKRLFYGREGNVSNDVVVDEDVWIGANVTLLPGVKVGRGANVGANSVVRKSVPPYSVIIGNPAKVIGFSFTPDEIIEHEKILYPEEERLPRELLEKNYEKYFLKRIKEIKEFIRL